MTNTRVLYIGGTGTISAACVRRSRALGHDVWILNRGSGRRPLPDGVRSLTADVRDADSVTDALQGLEFDVVADFLSFTPEHVAATLEHVEARTNQYVFISSASAYEKPVPPLPIVESTPLHNPFWQYSRDKIACESMLWAAREERGLPVTIVRPSHTYDEQRLPNIGRYTDVVRMREGKPVIVPGDGTSLWTLTHSDDFAVGFAGLLGLDAAIGEAVHITTDDAPTWNHIYAWIAAAAGVEDPRFVHVASESLALADPDLGPSLLGDKSHSVVFDNTKIRTLVPEFAPATTYEEGARHAVAYADSDPDQQRDPRVDLLTDRFVRMIEAIGPI